MSASGLTPHARDRKRSELTKSRAELARFNEYVEDALDPTTIDEVTATVIEPPQKPTRVFHVVGGSAQGFGEGDDLEIGRVTESSHSNSLDADDVVGAFTNYFTNYVRKTAFTDPDDLCIYRYGFLIRTVGQRSAANVTKMEAELTPRLKAMAPPGTAIHVTTEKGHSLAYRIAFGDNAEDSFYSVILQDLRNKRDLIREYLRVARDVMEDGIWFAFWDMDEADVY